MKNKGKLIAGVTAVLIGSVSPVFFCDADMLFCENVYDISLKIETVNVDINNIPEDRKIRIPVYIDRNPGFLALFMGIEYDSRLNYDMFSIADYNSSELYVSCGLPNNNTILGIDVSNLDSSQTYNGNGNFISVNLILPDNVSNGDYYPVKFSDSFFSSNRPSFYASNSEDSYYGPENFNELISGGIRITGEPPKEPEPTKSPEPTPGPSKQEEKPSSSPSQPSQSNSDRNNSSDKTDGSTTDVTVSATVSETVTVSETTAVSAEETTVSETSAETSVSTVSDTTCGETSSEVSAAETSEVSSGNEKKKSKSTAAGLAGITGALIGVLVYRYNKKRGEKIK